MDAQKQNDCDHQDRRGVEASWERLQVYAARPGCGVHHVK